jgi:hypothetical protein
MRCASAFVAPAPFRLCQRVTRFTATTPRRVMPVGSAGPSPGATLETSDKPATTRINNSPRYACPDCRTPANPLAQETCTNCGAPFDVRNGYFDLASKQTRRPQRSEPIRQRLFQSPLVSFAYENLPWRSNFEKAGFPGPDAEFKMIRDFFSGEVAVENTNGTGIVLDLSCGSGLIARRMVTSGVFSRVIAADLSAAMLREALNRANSENISFDAVRLDVAHLPFEDSSLPYVHAGAALHCWPFLQDGLAEVYVSGLKILLKSNKNSQSHVFLTDDCVFSLLSSSPFSESLNQVASSLLLRS